MITARRQPAIGSDYIGSACIRSAGRMRARAMLKLRVMLGLLLLLALNPDIFNGTNNRCRTITR